MIKLIFKYQYTNILRLWLEIKLLMHFKFNIMNSFLNTRLFLLLCSTLLESLYLFTFQIFVGSVAILCLIGKDIPTVKTQKSISAKTLNNPIKRYNYYCFQQSRLSNNISVAKSCTYKSLKKLIGGYVLRHTVSFITRNTFRKF